MAGKYVKWTPVGKKLTQKYWPGPLTVILTSRILHHASHQFLAYRGKIAIRVPDNKIAQMISKKLGRPITSTSANISNYPECYSATEFLNQTIGNKWLPDLILDAGNLPKRKPSSIADAAGKKIVIMRKGVIKLSL